MAAHVWRVMVQLKIGDVHAAEVDLAAASCIADELRQPDRLWEVIGVRAMLALAAGRFSEAEKLVPEALALGEQAQPHGAIPIYWVQRYTLCGFRGSIEEVEPEIRGLVANYPARPVFRCVLAHLDAQLGRMAEAQRALDDLAVEDFSALPFDQEWLYGTSLLAETCALLHDTVSATALYRLLLPWASFNAVDHTEGIRGSIARYLGLLATVTTRFEDAELHFEDAIAANARMGARPWLAHTQADYARMLLERGDADGGKRAQTLLQEALTTYRELGMDSHAAKASALAAEVSITNRVS